MAENIKSITSNFGNYGKYAMVFGVIVVISFLFPSSIKFKYEFQKGKTWRYEKLDAPFDFPIKKPEHEIREDRARIEQDFSPYYRLDPQIEKAKQAGFKAVFQQQLSALPDDADGGQFRQNQGLYLEHFEGLISKLYRTGIIAVAPPHKSKGQDFVINVVEGNITFKRTLQGFLTVGQAHQVIQDSIQKMGAPVSSVLIPVLEAAVAPNLTYDEGLTSKLRSQALKDLVTTKGVVRKGENIVSKGAIISDEIYEKLVSYRDMYRAEVMSEGSLRTVYVGYFLLLTLILGVFLLYVNTYRKEILQKWNYLAFVLMWLPVFGYLTFLVEKLDAFSSYLIPFCIVPIIVRHFFTYRLAFFTHVVVVLVTGFLTSLAYQFTFMQILAGVVAVLAVADARDWSKFFKSVLSILVTYLLAYLGLSLVSEGDIRNVDWSVFSWLIINGVLTLLAFPLIPLIERAFGFTSSISLVELSDTNRPLLRELSIKAPGTLQHSLQVANLCEAAATAIGANQLLVRTGALYHDIGKMESPEFFIENQSHISPHNDIGHKESARIIIAHVTHGARLAKKHRLPQHIIDFITTHHGTTKVEYFYRCEVKDNPGAKVNEALFTYPGPRPTTKEQTILMLADSVEATSRTLNNPTGGDLDKLVDSVFEGKISKGQLDLSKLTIEDLEKCRTIFKKMLRSIYHIRIEYPKELTE